MDEQGQDQRRAGATPPPAAHPIYAFCTLGVPILIVVWGLVFVVFFAGVPLDSAMRTIECRVEVAATAPGATLFSTGQEAVHLGPPTSFHVAEAYRSYNSLGGPAVGFRLAKPEWPAFRRCTAAAAHQNQRVALLFEGRVVLLADIQSPLPGSGTLDGWPDRFTEVEVQVLVDALQPGD